jgi:dTDP-4-amino-4,6-dideoxygalactose transaminase
MTARWLQLMHAFARPGEGDPRDGFGRDLETWFGGAVRAFPYFKGRVALHAVCRALDLRPGDEVVMPGFTCVVVPRAFLPLGARAVYVDIDPDTYNVRPEAVLAAIGPRTRMVLVQHTFGIPAPTAALVDACARRGIPVVEDACHAFGTMVDGRPAGTVGDAAFLSAQWNKPFTTGLGGILLVRDPDLAARVAADRVSLEQPGRGQDAELAILQMAHAALVTPRTHGLAQEAYRALSGLGLVTGSWSADEFSGPLPNGYFKDMGRSQAVAGRLAARSFAANVDHRRHLQDCYRALLAGTRFAAAPDIPGTVLSRYPIRVANKADVVRHATRSGVEIGSWFETPLHPMPLSLHPDYGYQPGSCPESERAAREVVNLPISVRSNEADAARAIRFLENHARPVG